MVFYFSGTGNSQFVAKEISVHIQDEIVSINHLLKKNEAGEFRSETPLVFVTPTYAWRIPKIVEKWLSKAKFHGNKNAYFTLTCGDSVGNAAQYAKRLCEENGLIFKGLAPVIMPENYLALFPTPEKDKCQAILEKSKPSIELLARFIEKGESLPVQKTSIKDKALSGIVNDMYYPLIVKDKGFYANDNCISCGECEEICPLNNIKIASEKPVWHGDCTHCMACIARCPTEAIEYKKASKGRHRHYIMEG
ncbi:MAG TPA: EFR1 family ferrodoxin [Clostridia bacterium]|nr:EFR1 family ferrodoxin [Clostridia bacterium]